MFNKNIINKLSVEDRICARDKALALIKHAHKSLEQADELLRTATSDSYGLPPGARPSDSISRTRSAIDERLWRNLFEHTGLSSIMDAQAKNEMARSMERDAPEFSIENIRSQIVSMHQTHKEMFGRGVYNLFARLSKRHVTNTKEPFGVSEKNILPFAVEQGWGRNIAFHLRYGNQSDTINDLDRVLTILDGGEFQSWRLVGAVQAAFKEGLEYEDARLKLKPFKNGNVHIWIKNPALLEKVNDTIAEYCGDNALATTGEHNYA